MKDKSKEYEEKVNLLIEKIQEEKNKVKRMYYIIKCKKIIIQIKQEKELKQAREDLKEQNEENRSTARKQKMKARDNIIKISKKINEIEQANEDEQDVNMEKEKGILELDLKYSIQQLNNVEKSVKNRNRKIKRKEKSLTVIDSRFNIFTKMRNFVKSFTSGIKSLISENKEKKFADVENIQNLERLKRENKEEEEKINIKYKERLDEEEIRRKYEDEMIQLENEYLEVEMMIERLYKARSKKANNKVVGQLKEELKNAKKIGQVLQGETKATEEVVQSEKTTSENAEQPLQEEMKVTGEVVQSEGITSENIGQSLQEKMNVAENRELELQNENEKYLQYYNNCNDIKKIANNIDAETIKLLNEIQQILRRKMDRIKDEYSITRLRKCKVYEEKNNISTDSEEIKKKMSMYINMGQVSAQYVEEFNRELQQKYEKNQELYNQDDEKLKQLIPILESLYGEHENEINDFKNRTYERNEAQKKMYKGNYQEKEEEVDPTKLDIDSETLGFLKSKFIFGSDNGTIDR